MSLIYLTPTKNGTYRVTETFTRKDVVVLEGFETDGLSIPQVLRTFTYSPYDPKCIVAATIHDYLYGLGIDKRHADKLFLEILLEDGVNRIQAKLMYYAVKWFGSYRFASKVQ